jgi:S-layer protein (TIGR01567 family)
MKKSMALAISVAMISIVASNVAETSGDVEVRGQIADISIPVFTWNTLNFPGFFYDPDENVGNEQITFRLSGMESTDAILDGETDSDGNMGISYSTTGQPRNFKFKPWGRYNILGFLGDGYFASYDSTVTQGMKDRQEPVAYLYDNSQNKNLMRGLQIDKVLIDDNTERVITSSNPLKLEEGYVLSLKNVDESGNIATLELTKDSKVIDSKVIRPSISDATMADRTYYYKADIGAAKGIIQIAAHFKNVFRGADTNIGTIDGIFQISNTPTPINVDQQYDKMRIRTVDYNTETITMDNKDSRIILSKNKDTVLMRNIHIKTADQGTVDDANPLRYYICKMITVEPEASDGETAAATNSIVSSNGEESGKPKPPSVTINEGL